MWAKFESSFQEWLGGKFFLKLAIKSISGKQKSNIKGMTTNKSLITHQLFWHRHVAVGQAGVNVLVFVCLNKAAACLGAVIHSYKRNENNFAFKRRRKKKPTNSYFSILYISHYPLRVVWQHKVKMFQDVDSENKRSKRSHNLVMVQLLRDNNQGASDDSDCVSNAVIISIPVENVPWITVFWGGPQTLCALSVSQCQNPQQWLERLRWKTKSDRACVCI